MGKPDVRLQWSEVDPRLSQEDLDWLNAPPVGREFGSPDFDRLAALDDAAFAVFQSWEHVRRWLGSPEDRLDGAKPEDVARTPVGYSQVLALLT